MWTKPSYGFVITFVVTGDRTGNFQTVNFGLFKPEKDNYLYTFNADSVAPKVSFESSFVFCVLMTCESLSIYHFRKKVFNPECLNLLSYFLIFHTIYNYPKMIVHS